MQNNKLLFVIGLLILVTSCSKEKNQDLIKSFISAHNAHDVGKTLNFYDQAVVFELKGVWTKEGLDEMSALEKWDSTLNSHLKLDAVTSKGDTLFCRVIENNDWFKAVNIFDVMHDPAVFIIKNEKINKIIGYPSEEIGKELEIAIGSLYQWSQQSNDATINELIQNGQFVYSAEAANKWLALFERRKAMDNSE